VVQVVGLVARRIVSWVGEGDKILQGQKIGMLRFGSRTDVFVPKSKVEKILVKKGERVFAGKTVLLRLKI
ncbi:MAG: phosphatidylserine decarboxylase, partial [Candidatus Aenigmarchaeota archaeon]|nr:phosphatidylserine decarboxylase [Candidatus Aenigmarchaeota archaeon]